MIVKKGIVYRLRGTEDLAMVVEVDEVNMLGETMVQCENVETGEIRG